MQFVRKYIVLVLILLLIPTFVFADSARKIATNEVIATYGNETRDYQEGELAVWEAATDLNLPGTTTSYVLECYDDAASYDDYVRLDDSTCDTDYFRIIRPAGTIGTGDWEGHDGTPNNGVVFAITGDTFLFRIDESYSQIQDIIGSLDIDSIISRNVFGLGNNDADGCAFVGCIALKARNAGTHVGLGFSLISTATKNFVINCLAHDCDIGFYNNIGTGINSVYNSTAQGCDSGVHNDDTDTTLVLTNVVVESNTTNFVDDGGGFTKTTCTDDDGVTFVNFAGDDFHLAVGDVAARGNGTDLSGDGAYPFDDDIDGTTRSAWDIGFDEYEAIVVGMPMGVYQQHRRKAAR